MTLATSRSSFVNRELSWLEFNQRVLDQAIKPELPLLERVKFLAISDSNLDEFYMVRVGSLLLLKRGGRRVRDIAGFTPNQQLQLIRARVETMIRDQYSLWNRELLPMLIAEHIGPKPVSTLSRYELDQMEDWFDSNAFPLLTPLAVEDEQIPFIAGLRLIVAAQLRDPDTGEVRLALVPIPEQLPRRVPIPGVAEGMFAFVEDLVRHSLCKIFPGELLEASGVFRLTRNGDIVVQDEDSSDLAGEMEEMLTARKFSDCVRLEIQAGMPDSLVREIQAICGASKADTYLMDGPLSLAFLMELATMPGYDHLKTEQWEPQSSPQVDPGLRMFENISNGDILINHPYESFEPVLRFLEEAAQDPDVLAIKQVLYRTARNSRVVDALIRAAQNGKQVTVLVELKARFDEERNLTRADELMRAGVQVVYGVKGLKTHAKIMLVVRRENGRLVRYCHFGTGNYNESTARLYTDVSLLTCDADLTADASLFFNTITGRTRLQRCRKLFPAPTQMKARLIELIDSEAQRASQGEAARILAKMNSLQDPDIMEALYRASRAGVEIQLNVRGICCLRPGFGRDGRNIHVVSIVDRYLEHSRIFYFLQGGQPQLFISSADWMTRNLDKRVELMVPVDNPVLARRLTRLLNSYFEDNTQAYEIREDGKSYPLKPKDGEKPFRVQEHLAREARRKARAHERDRLNALEPHIAPGS